MVILIFYIFSKYITLFILQIVKTIYDYFAQNIMKFKEKDIYTTHKKYRYFKSVYWIQL